jgi:hypothetical protein
MKRGGHIGVTVKYDIEIQCIREPSLQCIIQKSVCSRFIFRYLNQVCLEEKNIFSVNIAQRRISEAQIWQTIGMRPIGISFKAIGRQLACEKTHPNQHH